MMITMMTTMMLTIQQTHTSYPHGGWYYGPPRATNHLFALCMADRFFLLYYVHTPLLTYLVYYEIHTVHIRIYT